MKAQKIPGRCLFCGGNRLSKEHIWPQWTSDLLPKAAAGAHIEHFMVRTSKIGATLRQERKQRPGQVTTKKIRVVCVKCNNEWMSVLESSVKTFMPSMMLGHPITLSQESQQLFVQWVTLKLLVAEQNRPAESIWHQSDRDAFFRERTIPAGMTVWIAQCYSELWQNAYLRHAATFGMDRNARPADGRKNSQVTAFGIGQLFILAMASMAKGVDLGAFFSFDERFTAIWPATGRDLNWPPPAPITHDQANRASMAFEELVRHSRTLWIP
jgi:hypothetical protein